MTTFTDVFRRCVLVIVPCIALGVAVPQSASATETTDEITVLAKPDWPGLGPKGTYRAVLCVSGYKFFQTIRPADDETGPGAISTVQIYEERAGQAVPVSCK